MTLTSIFTQDGTVIVRCPETGFTASAHTPAEAERRLAEKRNMWSPRLPSSDSRKSVA